MRMKNELNWILGVLKPHKFNLFVSITQQGIIFMPQEERCFSHKIPHVKLGLSMKTRVTTLKVWDNIIGLRVYMLKDSNVVNRPRTGTMSLHNSGIIIESEYWC